MASISGPPGVLTGGSAAHLTGRVGTTAGRSALVAPSPAFRPGSAARPWTMNRPSASAA